MDIPVRVSINRKSLDGKNANGPYRDGKEGKARGHPLHPGRGDPLHPLFHSGLVFTLHGLLLHNLQGLVYF